MLLLSALDAFNAAYEIISTNSGIAVIPVDGIYKQIMIKKNNQHSFNLCMTGIDSGYKFEGKISDLEISETGSGLMFILKKYEHNGIPQQVFEDGFIKFKICEFF